MDVVCRQVTCKFCNSIEAIRNGKRRGIQYDVCKQCGRGFVDNDALPRMKYPARVISSAVYQYDAGVPLNEIRSNIIKQNNLYPADSTIWRWITRFGKMGANPSSTPGS